MFYRSAKERKVRIWKDYVAPTANLNEKDRNFVAKVISLGSYGWHKITVVMHMVQSNDISLAFLYTYSSGTFPGQLCVHLIGQKIWWKLKLGDQANHLWSMKVCRAAGVFFLICHFYSRMREREPSVLVGDRTVTPAELILPHSILFFALHLCIYSKT